MRFIKLIVLGVLLGGLGLPIAGRAADERSVINERVTIKQNSQILIDGKRTRKIKLDILPDKNVFRYQIAKEPIKPINTINIVVELPATITSSQVKANFIAVHGVANYQQSVLDDRRIQFTALGVDTTATVTITLDLPKNALTLNAWDMFEAAVENLSLRQWFFVAISLPAAMTLFVLGILVSRAKDIWLSPMDAEQASPPSNLPPAFVGVLLNGYVGVREIAATLIDLASRRYTDIIFRSEQDFAFSQRKLWQSDAKLQSFEKLLLEQLFTNEVISSSNDINDRLNKHVWSESVSQSIESIYDQMAQLGYFERNPKQVHLIFRFTGIIIFFLSVIGLAMSLYFFSDQPFSAIPWVVSMVVSPIIIHLALLVPRRTAAGRDQARRWLAFRQYLSEPVAAQYSEETEWYERYLAYAVALGAEGAWTARFNNFACRLPEWFYSQGTLIGSYNQFATVLFAIIGFVGQKFSFARKPTAL